MRTGSLSGSTTMNLCKQENNHIVMIDFDFSHIVCV